MDYLNDGYKDLMNISLDGGKQTKYLFNGNDTVGIVPDTVDFENRIRPITARMCVRPIAKDITSKYDKISEFIVYVREKNKISLIAIEGNIYTFEILTLTKLANLKGILKQTMELKDL